MNNSSKNTSIVCGTADERKAKKQGTIAKIIETVKLRKLPIAKIGLVP